MTHQQQIQKQNTPAQASSKARFNSQKPKAEMQLNNAGIWAGKQVLERLNVAKIGDVQYPKLYNLESWKVGKTKPSPVKPARPRRENQP